MGITITYKIAMAAGQDAANRRMVLDGRDEWNDEDWNEAARVTSQLLGHEPTSKEIFGARGAVTFSGQSDAESYLRCLPVGYNGHTRRTESGKWIVSYRRVA